MSASLNEVNLLGNIGADADHKFFENTNTHMTTLSLCTEEIINYGNGSSRKEKSWHRIVLWGNVAIGAKDFKKGEQVYVSGKLNNRKYQDNSGQDCYITEIIAHTVIATEEREPEYQNTGGFSNDPLKPNNPSNSISYA